MRNIKITRKAAILAFTISTSMASAACANDPPATSDRTQPTIAAQVQPNSAGGHSFLPRLPRRGEVSVR